MFLSEQESKELLSQYGLSVPAGRSAGTPQEAEARAREITATKYVVKAQIPAGGRGLAGGVKFAATPSAVAQEAAKLLGTRLVTDQTGADGELVESVYVEAAIEIANSYFIAIAIDPASGAPMLLAAPDGGVEFEQRARMDSDVVQTHLLTGDGDAASADIAAFLTGIGIEDPGVARDILCARRAFLANDMTLLEINPFAATQDGRWMALDAKISLDANAMFRRPEFADRAAAQTLSDSEMVAARHNINLVKLDGSIGVVANGAGLGLATNDMLIDAGGHPANFMDVRTTATSMDVARGVELLLADPKIKVILLNVHGGGMTSADTVAEGVNFAYSRNDRHLPVVAHMSGLNAEWGIKILRERRVPVETHATMSDAVARVVELAR